MRLVRFLRMAKWARRPPSESRVKLVLGIVAVCLLILLAEWAGLLPGWMALDPRGR